MHEFVSYDSFLIMICQYRDNVENLYVSSFIW